MEKKQTSGGKTRVGAPVNRGGLESNAGVKQKDARKSVDGVKKEKNSSGGKSAIGTKKPNKASPLGKRRALLRNNKAVFENAFRGVQNNADYKELKRMYEAGSLDLDEDQLRDLQKRGVFERPAFPIITVWLAIFMDVVGFVVELASVGTIGTVLMWGLNVIFSVYLWFWLNDKPDVVGPEITKMAAKRFFKRGAVVVFGESIPIVGMFPFWTIFILMTHYGDTKIVQLASNVIKALENPLKSSVSSNKGLLDSVSES